MVGLCGAQCDLFIRSCNHEYDLASCGRSKWDKVSILSEMESCQDGNGQRIRHWEDCTRHQFWKFAEILDKVHM